MTKAEAARVLALYLVDHPIKERCKNSLRRMPRQEHLALCLELEEVLLGQWRVLPTAECEDWNVSGPVGCPAQHNDAPDNWPEHFPQAQELLDVGVYCVLDLIPVTP